MTYRTAFVLAIVTFVSAALTMTILDAAQMRHRVAETYKTRIFEQALPAVSFASSIVIDETNPSTNSLVLRMFNIKLGQEVRFLATMSPGGFILVYEPEYYNDVIVSLQDPRRLTLSDIPSGTRAIATMYFDDEGRLQVQKVHIGAGSWDR